MIARIRGTVIDIGLSSLLVDVNGVGYDVLVPQPLIEQTIPNQEVTLLTYHHIRENLQELFGFDSFAAKKLFELLISVASVGPKSAMNIMALGTHEQIRQAIAAQNVVYIAAASGIGKKSAERICNELRDKVGILAGQSVDIPAGDDAFAALVSLGYNNAQAARALSGITADVTTEERVRLALKELAS